LTAVLILFENKEELLRKQTRFITKSTLVQSTKRKLDLNG